MITIDFETRSIVDLRKCGPSVYARHPSTEVLCLAWSRHGKTQLWTPDHERPEGLLDEASWRDEIFEAHNVFFERNIWHHIMHKRHGWPDIDFDNWRCSMAVGCFLTLPRSLGEACQAAGIEQQKDDAGRRVMLRLSKPLPRKSGSNGEPVYDEDPVKFQTLYDYCKQDVRAETDLSFACKSLPDPELKLWQLDQHINLRGLKIDRPKILQALSVVDQVQETCKQRIKKLTNGQVSTPKQVQAICRWVESATGEKPEDLTKATVTEWLERDNLDSTVREVFEIRQVASKASTSKLKAMLDRSDDDDRVRGHLVYHGASTGRWAGSGIQIQNFPRGILSNEDIERVHKLLPRRTAIDQIIGSPIDCISSSLRSMITCEKGHRLMVCDFASIEARVLAWVAGQGDLIDIFHQNKDVYKAMAAKIYEVPEREVDKSQRQIGKVAILGLGYGMGHKTFQTTCKTMAGRAVDRKFAKRVVQVYRKSNHRIAQLWKDVNATAIEAIESKTRKRVGRIAIEADGKWMRIILPSGRPLNYCKPRIVESVAKWSLGYRGEIHAPESIAPRLEELDIDLGARRPGYWVDCDVPKGVLSRLQTLVSKTDMQEKESVLIQQIEFDGVNSVSRKWSRQRTYGGKLVENITQAIARDFLAEGMFRVENAGYPIVATVHDEVVCEVPDNHGTLAQFNELMRILPMWGLGCPIEVEGFESQRYRK